VLVERLSWSGMALVVRRRADADAMGLVPAVRATIAGLDRQLPVEDIARLSDRVSLSLGQRRFALTLLSAFSVLALLLAAVGIYGVVSYTAAQRTREVGVRMALGARRADVLGLFVREAVTLAAVGVGTGLVLCAAATRLLSGLLFGVKPTDPLSYAAVSVLLAGAVLAASFLPALRAAGISPIEALRNE
jgi:putative ABC transport system permease protein